VFTPHSYRGNNILRSTGNRKQKEEQQASHFSKVRKGGKLRAKRYALCGEPANERKAHSAQHVAAFSLSLL
jgi:hypothetical protein